jgi:prolipoprotein diacylglyceryltransferase
MFPLTDHPHLAHILFETAGISSGAYYYRWIQRRAGVPVQALLRGESWIVLLGCMFGAAIGNKLVFWAEVPHLLPLYWNRPEVWFGGQSMVGGLLGALLGVELAKRLAGVRYSTGDAFVFPVLLGLMIGRTGCFVAGLEDGTYGIPTRMPWGVDFGDGIPRHPTQLYEILFAAVLWAVLHRIRERFSARSGLLFKAMLSAYLFWRLLVDGLKPVPYDYGLGLSGIQAVCAAALSLYLPITFTQWKKLAVNA